MVEIWRVFTYARHSDRRKGFLAFQRYYIQRKLKFIRNLTLVEAPITSGSTQSVTTTECKDPGNLSQLLTKHGSDKATTHDYDTIYVNYARLVGPPKYVAEIGLGTTGGGPSSMGAGGHPGASVRAFRDWGAEVIGADIDKSILVNESGITCYYVNQMVPRTLNKLVREIQQPLDLAIVDGLHTPEADLNSLLALTPCLSLRGLLVIEDIEPVPEITDLWCDVVRCLPVNMKSLLIRAKASVVLLVTRSDNPALPKLLNLYPSDVGAICASGDVVE